jgi:transcriptional regulator with XRE-family HTH domain
MATGNRTKNAISKDQVRAARALIGWTREDLSRASGVPVRTLADLEQGLRDTRQASLERVQAALETAGVTFILDDGEGVRFRRS